MQHFSRLTRLDSRSKRWTAKPWIGPTGAISGTLSLQRDALRLSETKGAGKEPGVEMARGRELEKMSLADLAKWRPGLVG